MIREMLRRREEREYKCSNLLMCYSQMARAFEDIFPELPMLTAAKNSPFVPMRRSNAYIFVVCVLVGLLFYGLGFPIPACGSFLGFGIGAGTLALYATWKTRKLHGKGREKYLPANAEGALRIVVDYLELFPRLIAEMEDVRMRNDEWIRRFKQAFDEAEAEEKGGTFSILYVSRMKTCRIRVHFLGKGIGGGYAWFFYPNDKDYACFSSWMESIKEGHFASPEKTSNFNNESEDEFGDGTGVRRA